MRGGHCSFLWAGMERRPAALTEGLGTKTGTTWKSSLPFFPESRQFPKLRAVEWSRGGAHCVWLLLVRPALAECNGVGAQERLVSLGDLSV